MNTDQRELIAELEDLDAAYSSKGKDMTTGEGRNQNSSSSSSSSSSDEETKA